jgi:hypothetical protein
MARAPEPLATVSSSDLGGALADLVRALRPLDGRYMLIGGLAVVLRGFPRHTDDIDIAVLGAEVSAAEIAALLDRGGFEPRIEDAVAFAEQSMVLLYRHVATSIELDVSLAFLPFEREAIAHAERMQVEGTTLPVANVEDLLCTRRSPPASETSATFESSSRSIPGNSTSSGFVESWASSPRRSTSPSGFRLSSS